MKITRVTVEEYMGPDGIYAAPRLRVDLDVQKLQPLERKLPQPTPVTVTNERGTTVVTGQKYSFLGDLAVIGGMLVDHPEFSLNGYFPGRPWLPVVVNLFKSNHAWYLPLERARRELNRWQSDWQIVPSDWHAQLGFTWWRLQEKELTCRAPASIQGVSYPFCYSKAVTEIWRNDHYIPLCHDHHSELTAKSIRAGRKHRA